MKTHITLRLPADVARALELAAKGQERTRSAVVVRALRDVLRVKEGDISAGRKQSSKSISVSPASALPDSGVLAGQTNEPGALCPHGRNPMTCSAVRCKMKRGEV